MKKRSEHLRITAAMDQKRASAENIGDPVVLSECECLMLVTAANLWLYSQFSELGGDVGATAAGEYDDLIDAARELFECDGDPGSGLKTLLNGLAAILSGDKFGRFLPR